MKDQTGEKPLQSWKEIGAYLQRNEVTVRRWEKEEGLPVHRHSHNLRSSVYAYPSEIEAWKLTRRAAGRNPGRSWWRPVAASITTVLCLIMVGNGIRPQIVSAQQESHSKATREIWAARPDQALPAPAPVSPDGRHLAFVDWNTGDLWVKDLPSGANRRLTHYALAGGYQYVDSAVFSPDGSQIAYSWSIDQESITELRVIPISGGTPRTVRRGESHEYVTPFGWTPDNKQVLISRNPPDNTTQLALVSVRDGSLRPLKSFGWRDVHANLSPDGRWIAYDAPASDKTLSHDIFMLSADGSREAAVVQDPADDTLPVWAPGGKRIIFLSDRTGHPSLWSVPVNEGKAGNAELVKPEIGRTLWMQMDSNGTLYYNVPGLPSSKLNIYAAELGPNLQVSKTPVLAVQSFVNSNNAGMISPDGEYLAYRSLRTGSKPALVVKRLQTREERVVPLKSPLGDAFGLRGWFPDKRSVLVGHRDPNGPGVEFYRVNLETGEAELLHRTLAGIRDWELSPDGKFIIYTEDNAETAPAMTTRLVRFDLGTRRETELKKGEWYEGVGISPDSKQISYLVPIQGTSGSRLAVMPAVGGPSREVYRTSPWANYDRFVSQVWTPDQQDIIFVRQGEGFAAPSAIWKVPVAGGAAEPMGVSMNARLTALSLTPDAKRLFVSAAEQGPNEVWALENFLPQPR